MMADIEHISLQLESSVPKGSSLPLTLIFIVCIRVYSVRDLGHPFFQFGIRLQAFLHPSDNAAYRAVTVYGKVFSYLCQLIAPEFASQIDTTFLGSLNRPLRDA